MNGGDLDLKNSILPLVRKITLKNPYILFHCWDIMKHRPIYVSFQINKSNSD